MIYKINLSKGEVLSLNEKELEFILKSPDQIVVFRKDNGSISKVINKAHIVSVLPDYEAIEGIGEDRQLEERQPNLLAVESELDKIREKKPWAQTT